MQKIDDFLVPNPPPSECSKLRGRSKHRWNMSAIELCGKFDSKHRHDLTVLFMQSYSQVGRFPHGYHIDGEACPTHLGWSVNVAGQSWISRLGVSALEFDLKGTYLASVTHSGCLTVHDFDELQCQASAKNPSGLKEDETKQVFHISVNEPLDVVRWNLTNQYEVACCSTKRNEVKIFDIGFISSEPVELLRTRSTTNVQGGHIRKGLSDIAFLPGDNFRVFASEVHGVINIWDRRTSVLPCVELATNSCSAINSIKMNADNQIIFGANERGIIYMWDLRGGSSSVAFENNKTAYYSPLTSLKLSSELDKVGSLKAESDCSMVAQSIDLNPSCPSQLAFHLDNGWSGVFDIHKWQVTHIHCPAFSLDCIHDPPRLSYLKRKPAWLPLHSLYAVGSCSPTGLHVLDFYPDRLSTCHVDYNENKEKGIGVKNQNEGSHFIPLCDDVSACAAHPLNGTIVAGTKFKPLKEIKFLNNLQKLFRFTTSSVKEMTAKFRKLEKFEGVNFRRWQRKMHFLLTTLKVVYVLSTPMPEVMEDGLLEELRKKNNWENDDYICRDHILNGIH